ncbi:hypothetical protein H4582DRAFT_2072385 [Lactarius indigo]|nr:hypothetical protein H4582DRAFT_2072385 [Lactarius indigo]
MADNLNFIFPQSNWEGQAISLPQGLHINKVAPTPTRDATLLAPETTPSGFSPGTQPASAPALGTEAPDVPQPATWTCPDSACKHVSCGRLQELERHVLKHLPHYICCPHPDCDWRGNRRYSLIDHYKKRHPRDQLPDRGSSDKFIIYDGKRLAKRLVNREVTLEQANDEADASVRMRAGELGKRAMWNIQYE